VPTKKYKRVFEFVGVIIRNIVSFFHLGHNKKWHFRWRHDCIRTTYGWV